MVRTAHCPTSAKLRDYIRDRLDTAEDAALTAHVQGCSACEQSLADLVAPLPAPDPVGPVAVAPAPPELIERLRRLWAEAPLVAPSTADPNGCGERPELAGYEILDLLGQGGTGVVYRARQTDLGREVAVKMLAPSSWAPAQEAQRLLKDAATASKLRHPHVVPVFTAGEHRGRPFFVMELISGGSLAQRVRELVQSPRNAARFVAQAAHALEYAHHAGVCHRDVKPANILLRPRSRSAPGAGALDDLDACVTDFGVAARTREDTGLTLDGTVVGTPGYIAPEQIRAENPSPAADVYGLGAVLYECLTGRPPFRGATPFDTLLLTLQTDPVRPQVLNSHLSRDLETICLKALETEPGRRYPSAAALADDLERWLRGEPVRAGRTGPLGRGWRWCRRKPVITGLLGALVVTILGGLVVSLSMWNLSARNEARALAGEAQAQTNLRKEEEARREAEEEYAMLRAALNNHILSSSSTTFATSQADPIRFEILRDAEHTLDRLLARQPDALELRSLRARVVTQLGTIYYAQHQNAECVSTFERAIGLWEQLRDEERREPQNRAWRAVAYTCLEQACERAGQAARAQQCFETAFRIWQQSIENDPDQVHCDNLFPAAVNMRWLLVGSAHIEAGVPRRFQQIRERLDRMGGGTGCEFFFCRVRLAYLMLQAELCIQTGHRDGLVSAAREGSKLLVDALPLPSLSTGQQLYLVSHSIRVCLWLRRANIPNDALHLAVLVNDTLRGTLRKSPDDVFILTAIGESWHAIGKIHWDLHQTEECLAACRNAVDAHARVLELAPTPARTDDLARRYLQLGRKLCELGRLDEAEACFGARHALRPGDPRIRAQSLQELQKWAAELDEDKSGWSPEARRQHRWYRELHARLAK